MTPFITHTLLVFDHRQKLLKVTISQKIFSPSQSASQGIQINSIKTQPFRTKLTKQNLLLCPTDFIQDTQSRWSWPWPCSKQSCCFYCYQTYCQAFCFYLLFSRWWLWIWKDFQIVQIRKMTKFFIPPLFDIHPLNQEKTVLKILLNSRY